MKPKKLSKEMIKCLDKVKVEVTLLRTNGGFWTGKDTPMREYGMDMVPEWFFLGKTIEALIDWGLLIVWNSRPGRYGVFPVEIKITPDYEEKIKQYKI